MSTQALFEAIELGGIEDVRRLLAVGTDVNIFYDDLTPLIKAVSFGHMTIVQLLIDQGAKIDTVDNLRKSSALIWAIIMSKVEIAQLLASRMDVATLNIVDIDGKTAADWADIGGDYSEKVEEFKPVGAAIRARGGTTAADLAARA